jgi:hypothetical protein
LSAALRSLNPMVWRCVGIRSGPKVDIKISLYG